MKLYYTTFPDDEARERIAEQLVKERLAACIVSIPVSSIYPWDGELQEEDEVAALFKTIDRQGDALVERLEELHPYDVPCILEIPVAANDAYEAWADNELSSQI